MALLVLLDQVLGLTLQFHQSLQIEYQEVLKGLRENPQQ